ncbi:protein TSSC1, putative [Plasmodium chabaudi adami]|uniref:Protein TSSC1, putative n=1 Tax=Plasmodium chabaudi adami TaxID=5826 RepID=A0A1C6YP98_PLACE|nr:protein TSSC1, putative [Plasmodium chabaudi adami]
MNSGKILKNTYYSPFKSRCLSNVNNNLLNQSYNLHYFLLSSDNPCNNNEIHLIEYNDESLNIENVNIFTHQGEISNMVCLGMHEKENDGKHILVCSSGLYYSNDNKCSGNDIQNVCSLWLGDLNNFRESDQNEANELEDVKKIKNEIKNECIEEHCSDKLDDNSFPYDHIQENIDNKSTEVQTNSENIINSNKKCIPDLNKKGKLEKLCELKRDEEYVGIKNIAWNDYENEFQKIAIIDKYSYTIFDRNNSNNINFITSNFVNEQLNYGTFDPHHENVLAVVSDIHIYGYDIKSNKPIFSTYTNHKDNITSLDFNSNIPNILMTSSKDGYIKMWDLRYLKNDFFTMNIHTHWITSININHFHDELLFTTSTDNTVKLHKLEYTNNLNIKDKQVNYRLIKTYSDHEESVYKGAWSKTDAWVFASLSYDGRCVINSVPTEEKYKILL